MNSTVRVRYAPSPTGQPHLGNVRTALFNWLFAHRHGGQFIVRIEDTDRERYVPEALGGILEALRWLGLDWDEGPEVGGPHAPYIQSQRLPIYQEAAQQLVRQEHAYHCYCSPQKLEAMRQEQMKNHQPPGYKGRCRNLTQEKVRQYEDEGRVPVVRFRMAEAEEIVLQDLIRERVVWQGHLLDDFVILKSDGFPTYHLANVVDDHLMEISHVLRAEEWLSSTPRHLKLYQALDYEPPLFGHLPMILGPDRSKLSKRHGATSILEYKTNGYLPEVMVNFMALLGWSLDDKTEIMSRDVLVQGFSLGRVVKSSAIFNQEKLEWMNGVYIRQMSLDELQERILGFWKQYPPAGIQLPVDRAYLKRVLPLIQERLKRLDEAAELVSFFFQEDLAYSADDLVQRGMDKEGTIAALTVALASLKALPNFTAPILEEKLRALAEDMGLSGRQLFGLLRVVTTGRTVAPPLFATMEVLGKDRCLKRIGLAIEALTG